MKRLILAFLMFTIPALAFAQQTQYVPLNETLLHQAEQCEMAATSQIVADKKQIADLTKQLADAKAKVTPDATKAPAPVKADEKP